MKQLYAFFFLLLAFFPSYGKNLISSSFSEPPCSGTEARVVADSPQKTCKTPYGGKLSVEIYQNNKRVSNGSFSYTWYPADHINEEVHKLATGTSVSQLTAGTYAVVVVDLEKKCEMVATGVVLDETPVLEFSLDYIKNTVGCDADPVGEIRLNNPKNYKINWYSGTEADPDKNIPKYQSLDYMEFLPPGTYTIVATNESTGCTTVPIQVTVDGFPTSPIVTADITPDLLCNGTGSGTIATTIIPSATGDVPPGGYTYTWYNEAGTELSQFSNLAVASPLPVGTYSLRVAGIYTDMSLTCDTLLSYTIPHQPIHPVLSLSATPNSICDPAKATNGTTYTGSITAAVTNNGQVITDFSGYTFSWIDANGNTGTVSGTNQLNQLPGGTYTLTATNSGGCASDPVNVVINNTAPGLSLTLTPTAQTSCGSIYNGSISASLSKNSTTLSSGYQLEWFVGSTTSGAAIPAASISGNSASGLQGGLTYTVRATDNSTGCQTTASVLVPVQENTITPGYTVAPNSICSTDLATNGAQYTGAITVTSVDFNSSNTTDLSGYSFSWYKESNGSFSLFAGATSSSLSNLATGRYQVVATNTSLGCSSDPVTVEVVDATPTLALSLTPTAQTSCGSIYNGSISASLSKNSTTLSSGYQLEWFVGSTTSGAAIPAASISGNSASGLQGGLTYTVRATDNSTGCQTTASVFVPQDDVSISLNYSSMPNGICNPALATATYSGSISINSIDFNSSNTTDLSGYSFSWYKESNGSFSLIAGATSSSLSNLATGRYQVVATNTSLGCSSDPVTVEVVDATPTLALSLTPTAQTSCGSIYNGSISASLSKNSTTLSSGYQLEWFVGSTTSGAAIPAASISGNSASGLQGGLTYTVRATDNSTGCQTTASVFVPQDDVSISLNYSSMPNGICNPALATATYSGSISINSIDFNSSNTTDLSGYSFSWYKESNGSFSLVAGENGSSLSQLEAGRYQVVATNTSLGCSSEPVTVSITNSLPLLALTLNPTAQTSCGSIYNGSISASLSKNSTTLSSGYQLEWFVGSTTSGAAIPAASISGNTASGLQGGLTYTVRATDNSTGCQTTANIFVPEQENSISLTYSTIANTICDPSLATNGTTYQGGVVLTDILLNGVAESDFGQYNIRWYKQSGADYTLIADESSSSLSNIDNGNYQVEAVHNTLSCSTGRILVVVDETTTDPEVSISATPQVNCQAPYAGTLTASVHSGGVALPLSDYRFEWFTGTTTQGTPLTTNLSGTNSSQATRLASGYYTLRATNLNTGCVTVESHFLEELLVEPGTTITVQNIQSCDPDERGSLTANVFVNGSEVADYSLYTFKWYRGQSAAGTLLPGTGRTLTALDASNTPLPSDYYTVIATNNQTSCPAPEQTAFLEPAPPLFTISTFLNRAPSSCNEDGGVVTAWVNDGSGRNVDDYTFEWYAGQQTDPDANFYTDPPIQFSGSPLTTMPLGYDTSVELPGQTAGTDYYTNGATLFSRGAGIYTVVATRKGDGCKELAVVEVPYTGAHMPELVNLSNSVVCPDGTGSIQVRAIDASGAAFADQSKYKFYLFEGTNPGDTVTAPYKQWGQLPVTEFANLAPGSYTFLVKEFITPEKCISISRTIEIKQIAKAPVARTSDIVASNMCVGGNGSVRIVVGPAIGDNATTLFSISWKTAPGTMPADLVNQAAGSYPFSSLEAGTYTATVSGDTGCSTDVSFTIPGQPLVPVLQASGTHQTNCVPANGSITISGVSLAGAAASLSNYTISWYRGAGNLATGTAFYTGTQLTTDTLSAGTYYLVATQNTGTGAGSGCNAAPVAVIIRNESNATPISLSATHNTSCDDQAYNGIVSANVSAVAGNYTYQWYKDDVAYGAAGTQATPPALVATGPGQYRLELKESSGCVTSAQVEVTEDLKFPIITTTASLPQTSCTSGDGTASVTAITYGGATAAPADFSFSWTDVSGNTYSGSSISSLVAGTYTVVATKTANPGRGCASAPVQVVVGSNSAYPAISLTATANSSCDNSSFTGTVTAKVTSPTADYTYQWYKDGAALGAAGTQADLAPLTAVGPGVYRLEVTAANGCPVSAEAEVKEKLLPIQITTTASLPQTSCTSGDGTASVTAITYGGASASLADFSFSWIDVSGNTYSGSSISSLVAGTYTVVATKTANPGRGCASAPVQVVVGSNSAYPAISLTATANSSCDNSSFTGTVTAKVTSPTADYTYQWYKDGVVLGAAGTQADLAPLTAVGPGVYRLEVTAANGCPVSAEAEVKEKLLPIQITTTASLPQTSCTSGDGTASVTAITYGGATAAPADFSFSWTDANGNTYSGASISSLTAGTYTVAAIKTANPGMGCSSAPVQVVVGSNSAYPAISLTATANSSCDNSSFTGTVTAKVTSPTADYTYQWYKDGVVLGAAGTQADLAPLTAVGPGVYRLEVTAANGCPVSAEAEVKEKLLPIQITTTASLPQTSCTSGDGTASVTAITYGGASASLADFSFSWTDVSGNTYSGSSISSLVAGTYTVVATKTANPGMGCSSAPVQVVVGSPQPTVAVSLSGVNFSACDNTPNGSLTATITGASSYSYVLYKNGAATTFTGNKVSTTTLTFSNLEAAQYRLDVTDNNTCPATATLSIAKEVLTGNITLSHVNQSTCNNDGSLSITQIDFGNELFRGADILNNFSLQLMGANGNALTNTAVTTSSGATFNNLPAGLYTVKAVKRTGKGLNCSLAATDQLKTNSVKPTLQLADKKMISRCFGQTGLLAVSVDGNTSNGGRYTVDWMYRQTLSSSYTSVAASDFSITDLNAGYYTINVRDNVTNCTVSQEYLIEEVVVELTLSASASDQTNCDPDNGQIFVRVANLSDLEEKLGNNLTFDFEVYAGELSAPPANTAPAYKVSSVTSFSRMDVAGPSAYTIFAWFNGHRVCVGNDIAHVGYVDNKPTPVIEQETSLTICDPGKPNASAAASVNGLTEGYSFTWYKESVAAANKLAQTGPIITNLGLTDYIVEAQNLITGCIGYDTVSITALFPPVAFDSAMLTATLSNNCAVPNGTLEVNLASGQRDKFSFTWYRGTTANPDSLLPAGVVPYRQEGLAEGYYSVVAQDLENGCLSDAVIKRVDGEYEFPDFEIKVEPASCSKPGMAQVVGIGGEMMDYYIYDAHGRQISDQNTPMFVGPAGHYWLRVISPDGCDKQLPFEITEAVLPHNGVTANGDGVNDFMLIECIHLYPENLLRIYNRAGGLVYEMSGYDNSLRVFDGTGNKGLYLGGKDLPAGTYYWVLFRDNVNEKPKTGFLELIR
ncbi:fg-gap repeat protein [Flammeovirgaceae bacterium 311]|nr:fg-gap repeat protein [Flammeovirgaceae bacterium 311]